MKSLRRIPIVCVAVGLVFAFSLPAATVGASEVTPQEKKLIRAAKKEGTVISNISLFQDRTVRHLRRELIKRYGLGKNFKYINFRKGTGGSIAMARQEIKANKLSFDTFMVPAAGFFYGAAKQGAFLKLDSGQWKNHEELARKGGQYFEYPYFVIGSAYTFQPVWNASCPGMKDVKIASYYDIANPKMKGKTIVSDVTKSASYSITTIGLMEAGFDVRDMWKKLKATNPLVAFRTEAKMQLLINCERPVDMWNLTGRVFQAIEKDPSLAKKLRWGTYKEGQVVMGRQLAVMKGAPHPNAGKLFVEFLLSKEGVDALVEREVSIISFLKNYVPPASARPYLFDITKVKIIGLKDWVAGYKKFKKMRTEWLKVFR
ncbi:ABC transporter substrate-binding protein [Nitrospinota bacterium]